MDGLEEIAACVCNPNLTKINKYNLPVAQHDRPDRKDMKPHLVSYAKTLVLLGAIAAAFAVLAWLAAASHLSGSTAVAVVAMIGFVATSVVIAAGGIVVLRDRYTRAGRGDLFIRANRSRRESAIAGASDDWFRRSARALWRTMSGQRFVIGDMVEVLGPEEIWATLDAQGCHQGLPFQPEMLAFCGRRFRVHRNIDKILDYGGTRGMRKMRDAVTLVDVRCDGAAHDACQAHCYLLWHMNWLRVAGKTDRVAKSPDAAMVSALQSATRVESPSGRVYACQFTKLAGITPPIERTNASAYLWPLMNGNVTWRAFAVATATRLFNWVQELRSGVSYPPMSVPKRSSTPTASSGISAGARVRVLSLDEILKTLDHRGKNRGMGFPPEMAKYCGQEFEVESVISRIIDDASGKMLTMKYPCLVLKGVYASGETEMLCNQHELIYWREVWLERLV